MSAGQSGIIGRIIASISPPANNGIVGRVSVLPPNIQLSNNSPQTIEGEVTRTGNNGRVQISTPQGTLEVQVNARPLPAAGTRVEVQIPKGQTPRQVNITLPQQQPQNVDTPPQQATKAPTGQPPQTQAQINTQTGKVTTPPPRPQAVQNQDIINTARETRPAAPPAQTIQSGQNIRLAPLTSAQLQQALQTLPPAQLQPYTLPADNALRQAPLTLQVTTPLPLSPQSVPAQAPLSNITKTLGNTNLQPPSQLSQSSTAPNAGSLQNLNIGDTPQQTGLLLRQAPTANLGATIPFAPSTNLMHNTPIGIQIETVTSSSAQIKALNQNSLQNFQNLTNTVQNQSLLIQTGSPQSIPAIVIGKTDAGFPILFLQAPGAGLPQGFILQTPATNIQIGTTVTLRASALNGIMPQQTTGAQTQALQTTQMPLGDLLRPGAWPLMDDIMQTLQQATPNAAQSMMASVPNTTQGSVQLTLAAFLFVAAVRSGDFSSWLGGRGSEALQKAGKGAALGKLGSDMNALNRGDTVINNEWRAMPMPMMAQGEIQKITLYTKHNRDESTIEDDQKDQTRFIFDLDLTRMGAVQLDGLIQNQKRLDLVIRTQAPFSENMRQTMRASYSGALEDVGLYGELGFQGDARNWVNVLEENNALAIDL